MTFAGLAQTAGLGRGLAAGVEVRRIACDPASRLVTRATASAIAASTAQRG